MYISGNDVSGRGSRLRPHISPIYPILSLLLLQTMEAFRLRKKFPEVSNDEMLDLINRFKYVHAFARRRMTAYLNHASFCSGISTDTPGRVDKQRVLQSLQTSGESYDRAREVLKHVSVDSSGKVELEDWVEVRTSQLILARQGQES